ncbi:flagellin [bacterium]|nr:MAG: flagellin [bacterium]
MAFGDFNRISTNVQSLEARFSLDKINKRLGATQLKLSTGLRINKAEDDAAGFSISAKLSSRIAGLEQALSNTGDAKSVLDIAEASFNSILDILTTLKTKATQAANDTYGTDERAFIQSQVDSLLTELDALVAQTVYQGNSLLSGSYNATFQVGERTADTINVAIAVTGTTGYNASGLGVSGISVTSFANAQSALASVDAAINTVASVVNELGIYQTQLSIREEILTQSINSNFSARSRIRDADFAKEQSEGLKLQILQQTAIAALAQANVAPQAVLGFISA